VTDLAKSRPGGKKIFLLIVCLAGLAVSVCSYLGHYHFSLYQSEKMKMRSLERDFGKLQEDSSGQSAGILRLSFIRAGPVAAAKSHG